MKMYATTDPHRMPMAPAKNEGIFLQDPELPRQSGFRQVVARILIKLMIMTPLPAEWQLYAALYPASILWPLLDRRKRLLKARMSPRSTWV